MFELWLVFIISSFFFSFCLLEFLCLALFFYISVDTAFHSLPPIHTPILTKRQHGKVSPLPPQVLP